MTVTEIVDFLNAAGEKISNLDSLIFPKRLGVVRAHTHSFIPMIFLVVANNKNYLRGENHNDADKKVETKQDLKHTIKVAKLVHRYVWIGGRCLSQGSIRSFKCFAK